MGKIRADDLHYLAVVADTGHLVAAARSLGVDHSTVSRRLRALEAALGFRLIGRGHDGWELTAEGHAIAEQARAVRAAVERATLRTAGAQQDHVSGTVRITAADGFGSRIVTAAVMRVRREHPGISVELVTGAHQLNLERTNFDMAVTIGTTPKTHVIVERLCGYDSAFYASEDYLAQHGDPKTPAELAQHPLIYFVDSLERVRELKLEAYVPGSAVGFASTNIYALLKAARDGGGIALLSKFMASTVPDLRQISAPIDVDRVNVVLAIREGAANRAEVQIVRAALHQEVTARRNDLIWPDRGRDRGHTAPHSNATSGTSLPEITVVLPTGLVARSATREVQGATTLA
ncbi:LysR family transcriptional regulator [Curtobacterium flaccumfaciens]|uniref:LysR family transcriptional regulator n=1 Tax=Curtobacterium flaccumfaciens TaxID=2035 RepID=UPI00387A3376